MPAGSIIEFNKAFLIRGAIQWANILLLIAVLIYLMHKPVKQFMADRAARIARDLEAARANHEKAWEEKTAYEQLLANIEVEREEILNQAHRIAVERSDQILMAAREEAQHLMAKAESDIRVEREKTAEEIKIQIIELSTLMAARFVEVSLDRKTKEAYIDEALANWSDWT